MHLRQVLFKPMAAVVATGLLSAGFTLVAPAAQAAEAPSRVAMTVSKPKAHVGDKISISGQVQAQNTDGSWGYIPSDAGGVVLEKKTAGSKSWKTVATDDSGSSFYFDSLKTKKTTKYRVSYAGGSSGSYTFPAASKTKKVKAYRDLHDKLKKPGHRILLVGKVAKYAKKKIIVQQRSKPKGKWHKFRTVRTSKKGKFSVQLAIPRRGYLYYRAYAPASKGIQKSFSNYSYKTWRY